MYIKSDQAKNKRPDKPVFFSGWGGRIRTSEWLDQNQLPCRLATPHYSKSHLLFYLMKHDCQDLFYFFKEVIYIYT